MATYGHEGGGAFNEDQRAATKVQPDLPYTPWRATKLRLIPMTNWRSEGQPLYREVWQVTGGVYNDIIIAQLPAQMDGSETIARAIAGLPETIAACDDWREKAWSLKALLDQQVEFTKDLEAQNRLLLEACKLARERLGATAYASSHPHYRRHVEEAAELLEAAIERARLEAWRGKVSHERGSKDDKR